MWRRSWKRIDRIPAERVHRLRRLGHGVRVSGGSVAAVEDEARFRPRLPHARRRFSVCWAR